MFSSAQVDFTLAETRSYFYTYPMVHLLCMIVGEGKMPTNGNIKHARILMHNTEPIKHKIKINLLKQEDLFIKLNINTHKAMNKTRCIELVISCLICKHVCFGTYDLVCEFKSHLKWEFCMRYILTLYIQTCLVFIYTYITASYQLLVK